jgi:hypothetical protein
MLSSVSYRFLDQFDYSLSEFSCTALYNAITCEFIAVHSESLSLDLSVVTIVVATVSAASKCRKLFSHGVLKLMRAVILIVRTVAIWGGGRGVTYVAYGLYVAATIVAFVFSILSFKYTSRKYRYNSAYTDYYLIFIQIGNQLRLLVQLDVWRRSKHFTWLLFSSLIQSLIPVSPPFHYERSPLT